MKKRNFLYSLLFVFLLSSCGIRYTERNANGFGGSNWTVNNTSAVSVPHKKQVSIEQNSASINVNIEHSDTGVKNTLLLASIAENSAPTFNYKAKISKLQLNKSAQTGNLKNKPKWQDIKQVLSVKKELKKRSKIIPNSSSHWIQWLFFVTAAIFLFIGLYVVITVDPIRRDLEFALGVVSLIVGIIYYLGFITFPSARKKGLIFQIGYFSTFFLLLTFYSLAVTIPILLIGALFDI